MIKSKTDLSSELSSFKRRHHRNSSPLAIRSKMEAKLVPWIVAKLNSFPELKAIPSVFLSIMPVGVRGRGHTSLDTDKHKGPYSYPRSNLRCQHALS